MNDRDRDLEAVIALTQPDSMLVLTPSPLAAAEHYSASHPDCRIHHITHLPPEPGDPSAATLPLHDLAIIVDILETLEPAQGLEMLGTIRNRYASRIYLRLTEARDTASRWKDTDFFSLGMQRAGHTVEGKLSTRVFTYDLETYNRRRAWNSPKHWANPENFGKYWW